MRKHEQAVNNGIALLDTVNENWRENVKLEKLMLSSCNYCILGQLYGHYSTGLMRIKLAWPAGEAYGFVSDTDSIGLTEEWKRQLLSD